MRAAKVAIERDENPMTIEEIFEGTIAPDNAVKTPGNCRETADKLSPEEQEQKSDKYVRKNTGSVMRKGGNAAWT